MLSTKRHGLMTWMGVGSAILTMSLVGCGGNKRSSAPATGTAAGGATAANNDDHGDDANSATALPAGAPLAGSINYAGDADWFAVTLTAGSSYDVSTGNLANGMDTVLRLIDVDGTTVLAENDDSATNAPASEIMGFVAPADGDYYLAVFHKNPAADLGDYEVTLGYGVSGGTTGGGSTGGGSTGGGSTGGGSTGGGSTGGGSTGGGSTGGGSTGGGSTGGGTTPPDDHGNDPNSATAIVLGTPTAGKIEVATDEDYFAIDLTQGDYYNFRTVVADPTVDDTVLYLYDDNFNLLADNDDISYPNQINSEIANFQAPATATFYLVVTGYQPGGITPDYQILGETTGAPPPPPADDHGNDMANATSVAATSSTAGHIETMGDEDWFVVTLSAGQAYDFRTNVADPTADDTIMEIYDAAAVAAGQPLDQNDDINYPTEVNSAIDGFIPPADGDYYVVIRAFQLAAPITPQYDLVIDLAGGTPPPPPANDDHGNDANNATALTLGSLSSTVAPTAGNIEIAGDEDWFSVDLIAGANYAFYTTTQEDTVLTLYATDGTTVLTSNDDSPNAAPGEYWSSIDFTATVSGTHYLAVTGGAPTGTPTTPLYGMSADEINTPPPPPPSTAATIAGTTFVDVDGSGAASAGDTIVVKYSEAVTMMLPAIFPPPTITADSQYVLPVAGDSFGAGNVMVMGPGADEATITLGANPVLRLSGTFDAANVTAGSASGLDMSPSNTVSTGSSGLPAGAGVWDIETTLTPGFVAAADLNEARGHATATLLNDGRVLVVGGLGDQGAFAYSSEVHDAGVFTDTEDPSLGGPGGAMAALSANGNVYYIGRYDHTATLLPGGNVLVAGGVGFEGIFDANGNPTIGELNSAFVFNPTTNEFAPTMAPIQIPRRGHMATTLPNGQVLLAGGYNANAYQGQGGTLPFAEVFDEATGQFTVLQNDLTLPREGATAHVTGQGTVLYVGGMLIAPSQANPGTMALYVAPGTESYDMNAGGVAGPAMVNDRRWHAGAEDANGAIFALGGRGFVNGTADMLDTVEKYDPAAGGDFVAVGSLAAPRGRHTAHMLGDSILVVGGMQWDAAAGVVTNMTTGELYNTTANVVETYQLQSDRNSHVSVQMPNGSVMVIGGWSGGTTSVRGFDGTAVQTCESFQIP